MSDNKETKQAPAVEAEARDERAGIDTMFVSEADPEKFCFGSDPGDRPLDVKLARTVEQWAKCDPELMSHCSQAAVFYALRDAKTDILTLAARLRATGRVALARASEAAAGEPVLPQGFSAKRVEGHGWVIDPPSGTRWVAYEGTPAGELMQALAAPQPASEQQATVDDLRKALRALDEAREQQAARGLSDADLAHVRDALNASAKLFEGELTDWRLKMVQKALRRVNAILASKGDGHAD